MTVRNCLNKLVSAGRITREAADAAMAFHQRMQGKFEGSMGPTTAEAASALEAARLLEETALEKKASLALQAIRAQEAESRARAHTKGVAAGVMSQLTHDIWEQGGRNVWARTEAVMAELTKRFHTGLEAYRSRLAGLRQEVAGQKNMLRELFGVDTGDQTAKAAAHGWNEAVNFGVARVKAGGKVFEELEDWRLPQFWAPERIRDSLTDQATGTSTKAEFLADMKREIEAQNMWILDKETGRPTTADKLDARLEQAWRDMMGGSNTGAFSAQARTIHFKTGEAGAGAWLRLQEKYGVGQDIIALMRGHMTHMAREIALVEQLGPQHGATVRMLADMVKNAELERRPASRLNPLNWIESARMVEKTYDVLTGRANEIVSTQMAGIFGGLRNTMTAANLGGGVISAVPGDTVTMMLASSYNGIPMTNVVARTIREIMADPAAREHAARLNIVAHSMMDHAVGVRAYEDTIMDRNTMAKVASFVIRAQGMQAWTEGAKRAFTMEFMGFISTNTARPWDQLDDPLRKFLERYQFTAADWDKLRVAPQMDVNGAKFFDVSAVQDSVLGDRLLEAIISERRFAVLEGDARVQAFTSAGLKRGTFWGEISRSVAQFKSFSMTMATTHLMRLATQGTLGERALRTVNFLLLHFAAGAAAMQAKAMLQGRDPRDMSTPTFWGAALLQGGGLGIYGDLLSATENRAGKGFIATAAGPVLGLTDDAVKLVSGTARRMAEGKDTTFASQAFRTAKRMTPGSTLWYSRLATDRLIWDQLQTMLDPDYRQSFRRMEQRARDDYNQRFWWRPGQMEPERGPDLGAALQ